MLGAVRICIVTIALPDHGVGGMQDHAADLARGLARAGHDVTVVAPQSDAETALEGVRIHRVDPPGLHMDARWRAASLAAFDELHAREPFDVVHSEGSSALELVRRRRHEATPVVVMFHGNFLGQALAALSRIARRPRGALGELGLLRRLAADHFPHGNWRVFGACESIVPSAQQVRATRLSHMLSRDRVHVVPNGVDTDVFAPRRRLDARADLGLGDGPILLCVGRLNREKGVGRAVEALALLPEARLVVVGEGEELPALESAADELGLRDRVDFVGRRTHREIATYLAAADVFLFPTERDEAAPLVLPQALASGAAVVATRIGGIPEVVGDDAVGILVPPGDAAALASAAARVLAEPRLRDALGAAARARALERYSIEAMVEGTLEVYETALRRTLRRQSRSSQSLRRGRELERRLSVASDPPEQAAQMEELRHA
jgi:glycosyltransferase involved in cell wall biosynthesis